jgi:predicted component of type VI protein secretion system
LLLISPDESEITNVNSRLRIVLYSIEILRNGVTQSIFPVTKPEITIGRGSETVEVDLPLRGDAEVSRMHVALARDARGLYWLTAKGQNPVFINENEVERNKPNQITSMDVIRICSFSLRINVVANTCI